MMVCLTSMRVCRGNQDPADQGEDSRRHAESEGGFSFIAPAGWGIQDFPGLKYKIAVGPAVMGFAPNINVVDEPFTGSLDSYVEESLATLRRVFTKFRLLKQDGFTTTDGLQGARMVVEDEQGGRMLRHSFYIFSQGETKLVVTCTAPAESGDELAPTFEAIMKTFRFERRGSPIDCSDGDRRGPVT
jgi:hypothetical protein